MTKSETISEDFTLSLADGQAVAQRPDFSVVVIGDGAKVFHRRAIKLHADGSEERAAMLVAQLGDVKMYYVEGKVIMTREDLYL